MLRRNIAARTEALPLSKALKDQRQAAHSAKSFADFKSSVGAFNAALEKDMGEEGLNLYGMSDSEATARLLGIQIEPAESSEPVSIPAELTAAGGKAWVKAGKVRVYFNNPANAFGVDFGSRNKNFKADLGRLYFDVIASCWVYDGAEIFGEEIIEAAKKKTGF